MVYSPQVNDDLRESYNNPMSAVLFMNPRLIPTQAYVDAQRHLETTYSPLINASLNRTYDDHLSALIHMDPGAAHRIFLSHDTDLISIAREAEDHLNYGTDHRLDPLRCREHPLPPGYPGRNGQSGVAPMPTTVQSRTMTTDQSPYPRTPTYTLTARHSPPTHLPVDTTLGEG